MNANSLRPLVRPLTRLVSARASLPFAGMMSLVATGVILLVAQADEPKPPPVSRPLTKAEATTLEDRVDKEGFPLPTDAVARVGSARLRHGRQLVNLSYSPDSKILASSGGGLLRLWNTSTGKLLQNIMVAQRIPDGVFSANGKTVLALDGETCRWFDVGTGKEVRRCNITFPQQKSHACIAPHGEMIAVVGTDLGQDLVVYDLPYSKERFRKTSKDSWYGELAFSPDGKMLAAMELAGKPPSVQYRVRLFDTAVGKLIGEFDARETFRDLTFSPDSTKLLALNGRQKCLRVWSVPGGDPLHRIEPGDNALVMAAFSPDGKSVIVSNQGLDALLIDLTTGKELRRFRSYAGSFIVAFAPDGQSLAVGLIDGAISQWGVATGKRLPASADPIASFGPPLRFDNDGKLLWVPSETFALIDWQSGREVKRVRVPHELPNWSGGLALSPDRSRVAGVNGAKQPVVWDAASAKELCILPIAGQRPLSDLLARWQDALHRRMARASAGLGRGHREGKACFRSAEPSTSIGSGFPQWPLARRSGQPGSGWRTAGD